MLPPVLLIAFFIGRWWMQRGQPEQMMVEDKSYLGFQHIIGGQCTIESSTPQGGIRLSLKPVEGGPEKHPVSKTKPSLLAHS